jgi:HSP20 family molecular chaperone IbpA
MQPEEHAEGGITMTQAAVAEKAKSEVKKSTDVQTMEKVGENNPTRRIVVPRYEVFRRENGYEIHAMLPGVTRDGLSIELENRLLTLRAKPQNIVPEGLKPLYAEFSAADFEAAFRVPADVDETDIKAHLDDGVLILNLPSRKKVKQAITVNVD